MNKFMCMSIALVMCVVSVCHAEIILEPVGSEEPAAESLPTPARTSEAGTQEVETETFEITLDLADGSHLIGVPNVTSVSLVTSYAKIDVALAQIASVTMSDDHKTATLRLKNGDALKGTLDFGKLTLVTIFGRVAVPFEHVRGMEVSRSSKNSLLEHDPTKIDALMESDYYATSKKGDIAAHRLLSMADQPSAKILKQLDDWIFLHPSYQAKPASLLYTFSKPVSEFNCTLQTGARGGIVRYSVYADDAVVFQAVLRDTDGEKKISVQLGSCTSLKLEVDSAGVHKASWGIWGNPRVK